MNHRRILGDVGRCRRSEDGWLDFQLESPDVDASEFHAIEAGSPLIEQRHVTDARHSRRIARIECRAAGQQGVRFGRSAVVGKHVEQRVGAGDVIGAANCGAGRIFDQAPVGCDGAANVGATGP